MNVPARFKNALKDESGQALVLTGVGLMAIVAFLALAIDVGQLRYEQTKLQNAADAAAIAAALEMSTCGSTHACTTMQTAAKQALVENGFSGATAYANCATPGSGLTITINQGPCALGSTSSDPNYGNSQYVEVVVTYPQPTYFARTVGVSSVKMTVRAEAGLGNDPFCMTLLGTSGTTYTANGSSQTLTCGIMVNSSGSSAFLANGATVSATAIDVHGGDSLTGSTVNPTPVTNAGTVSDPLSYLTAPTIGSCGTTTASPFTGGPSSGPALVNSGTATFNPGVYCGGIEVNGGTATFNPGTYIITGSTGLLVNGGSISGTGGVTYYLSQGSVTFNGSYNIDLVAPTTGTYAGILFYQSSSDSTAAVLNGASGSVFQGALYFPDAGVTLNGSNAAAYTIVDAQSALVNGTSFNIGNNYSSLPGGSPAKGGNATLVE
jgi:Flp pilus assembly protein TadG